MALTRGEREAISAAVDRVYDQLTSRLMGPTRGKQVVLGFDPEVSMPGVFVHAARSKGLKTPDPDSLATILDVTQSHLDGQRASVKARVMRAVEEGVGRGEDPAGAVATELEGLWTKVESEVSRVVETEMTLARNTGFLEAVGHVNAKLGIDDPLVYFVVVRDRYLCGDCRSLHLMPDGVTPRVWRRSELSSGYRKRGEMRPSLAGSHPSCRCSLTTVLPGYGFDSAGMLTYVGKDHNEYSHQHS